MALTKHKEGSLRELWSIAFPLMISSFSVMLMLFVDRVMLARYSLEAHNAAVTAATLGWAFLFGFSALASIAEVFVAQFNGANQKDQLGKPVWQMIWFSIATTVCFVPLSIWGATWLYGSPQGTSLEEDYFRWMMVFGPAFPLYTALSTFFIGQGKTFLITVLAIIANIVNILLDYAFIFGVPGLIPSMGIKGAAIATFAGTLFQIVVLGTVFLNRKNRSLLGTKHYHFNLGLFWQCCKIGIPSSLFCFLEISGFAAFYWLMTFMEPKYITITGICQSLILLFFFLGEGVSKAAMTLAGNLIGANRSHLIPKVLLSGVKSLFLFFLGLTFIFILFPGWMIGQFIPHPENLDASFYHSLQNCMILILFCIFFEWMRLLIWGILTAAGDTLFLLLAGSLSIWVFLVLPVYLFVVKLQGAVEIASALCVFHNIITCTIFFWRFYAGQWQNIRITA